jgi:DNA (cytosine-5)-methyltransferase 1
MIRDGLAWAASGYGLTATAARPKAPFRFIQGDALDVLAGWDLMPPFDAIHASPPCRDHTPLTSVAGTDGTGWLLAATRKRLVALGLPWIIENVPGAPMRPDLVLCGGMFGLRTYRHRWFETSFLVDQPAHPDHVVLTATSRRRERWAQGWHVSITGDVGTYVGPEAMGIDWMTGNELCQAIPPAYTRVIGEQLLAHLAADPRPGPGPKPPGPTGPQPTHPPSMPPPAPVPAKTSTDVPARSVALVEAASMRRYAGTPARAGDLRGDLARAGTQTPVVVVGSGGGG